MRNLKKSKYTRTLYIQNSTRIKYTSKFISKMNNFASKIFSKAPKQYWKSKRKLET